MATLAPEWQEGHLLLWRRGYRTEVLSEGGWYIRGRGEDTFGPAGRSKKESSRDGICGTCWGRGLRGRKTEIENILG